MRFFTTCSFHGAFLPFVAAGKRPAACANTHPPGVLPPPCVSLDGLSGDRGSVEGLYALAGQRPIRTSTVSGKGEYLIARTAAPNEPAVTAASANVHPPLPLSLALLQRSWRNLTSAWRS